MGDYATFPFCDVSDCDLLVLLNGHYTSCARDDIIPLDVLDSMCFSSVDHCVDGYLGEVDPDDFLQGIRGFDNPNCNYYFPATSDCDLDQLPVDAFSVLSFNIGSVPKHLDSFVDQCLAPLGYQFDVIGFCETKLTDDIEHLYDIPSYTRQSNSLSRHSGGVSLYINNKYNSFLCRDLTVKEEFIETLFVEIYHYIRNIVVGVIYRRPNTNLGNFYETLNNLVSVVSNESKTCYLMGDFNIDLLRWETDINVSEYLAVFHSKLFLNVINKPTRVTASSASLIDHIWSDNITSNIRNGILHTRISDNFPSYLSMT